MTRLPAPQFPDPSAGPDDCAELIARWEAVLAKAPRLRPWLSDMIRQRRVLLHESARGSIERALWIELERWVRQFEALPQFAVSAISAALAGAARSTCRTASPPRCVGRAAAAMRANRAQASCSAPRAFAAAATKTSGATGQGSASQIARRRSAARRSAALA